MKWLVLLLMLLPLTAQAQLQPGYSIRIIEADLNGGPARAIEARNLLQADIAGLAQREGVTLWFHEYTSKTMAASPVIVLELPDEFMPEVRELPGYVRDYPAPAAPDQATQRITH